MLQYFCSHFCVDGGNVHYDHQRRRGVWLHCAGAEHSVCWSEPGPAERLIFSRAVTSRSDVSYLLLLPSALLCLVCVLCLQQGGAATLVTWDVSVDLCGLLPLQPSFNLKTLFDIGLCFVVLQLVRNILTRRPFFFRRPLITSFVSNLHCHILFICF